MPNHSFEPVFEFIGTPPSHHHEIKTPCALRQNNDILYTNDTLEFDIEVLLEHCCLFTHPADTLEH